jgi:hypothetical protein
MRFFKKIESVKLISFIQTLLLMLYFSTNISNVGGMGSGLIFLLIFFALSFVLIFFQSIQHGLIMRVHLFVFLILVFWIGLRVIIDLGDVEYLKQITIATTSGIVLFFLMGSFFRITLNHLLSSPEKLRFSNNLFLLFVVFMFCITFSFFGRLERSDIFLIEGINAGYQRSGNFLIINFIAFSFVYISFSSRGRNNFSLLLIFAVIYSAGMFLNLISSQMIGSNAATANIFAIYLMTMVMSFLGSNKKNRAMFIEGKIAFPISKIVMRKGVKFSLYLMLGVVFIGVLFILISGFDINKTRILGFGAYENTSITSRIDILKGTGMDQMGHSPIFGNVNVAYLTTGDAGIALHNFLPNIFSELGTVGLILIGLLFLCVFSCLIKNIKYSKSSEVGFVEYIVNSWLIAVLVFLFVYANFSVGKEWSVMWFYLGFAVSVFRIKRTDG